MSDSEIEKITPCEYTVNLGGKDRKIKYSFKAWQALEEKYDGFLKVREAMTDRPFKELPYILLIGIVKEQGENITETIVSDWLDDLGGMNDIVEILTVVKDAMSQSLPKSDGRKNPRKAKQE